jgi:hypothetical protein
LIRSIFLAQGFPQKNLKRSFKVQGAKFKAQSSLGP